MVGDSSVESTGEIVHFGVPQEPNSLEIILFAHSMYGMNPCAIVRTLGGLVAHHVEGLEITPKKSLRINTDLPMKAHSYYVLDDFFLRNYLFKHWEVIYTAWEGQKTTAVIIPFELSSRRRNFAKSCKLTLNG